MNTPDRSRKPDRPTTKESAAERQLRNDVTDMIAYALWRHWKQRPPKRDLAATRRWATYATAHLELCGIEWRQKPPAKYHSDVNFRT